MTPEAGRKQSMKTEFAKSLSGHDRNQIYLIVKDEEQSVWVANGTTKPLAAPKRKNRRHIQRIAKLPAEVTEVLAGEWTDVSVKRAIKVYRSMTEAAGNH